MDSQNQQPQPSRLGVTRRTIASGLAWTAPVIAVAPMAQAYTTSAPQVSLTGRALKLQGNSCCASVPNCQYYTQGFRFYADIYNPTPGSTNACVKITGVYVDCVPQFDANGCAVPGTCTPITTVQLWKSNNTLSAGCCSLGSSSIFVAAGATESVAIDVDFNRSPNTSVVVTYEVYNADTCSPTPAFKCLRTSLALTTPPTQGNCNPF